MDSGTKSTDVEEFVSESYLASSKDIAEADESIKRLRVSGMTHEQNNSANLEFPLHKRQSINDVMLIFRVLDPLPSCHAFTQPISTVCHTFGNPSSPLEHDVIYGWSLIFLTYFLLS